MMRSTHTPRTIVASLLISATLCFVCKVDSSHANERKCKLYAKRAIDQSEEYRKLSCRGGEDAWWTEDFATHFNWCMDMYNKNLKRAVSRGQRNRSEVLDRCQRCDYYARVALELSEKYFKQKCSGGKPEWWNTDYNVHRVWCDNLPSIANVDRWNTERRKVLAACDITYPPPSITMSYRALISHT